MTPYLADSDLTVYVGDALDVLRGLPDGSVDCCVTSPPYWGLRDYSVDGQIGLEATPDEFVAAMVAVFREVRRVLAPHGTCWVNLGDSYAASRSYQVSAKHKTHEFGDANAQAVPPGLKPKDLVGVPWRVAFALQQDGWWLRSDIIWAKKNCMPESVTDRPTKAHEYVFLLTRQPRYWFDAEAVREPHKPSSIARGEYGHGSAFKGQFNGSPTDERHQDGKQYERLADAMNTAGRNVRSVWEIATQPYPEAHFATFPEELPRRAIAAGCPLEVCRVCGKPRERIVDVSYGKSPAHGAGSIQGSRGVQADDTHMTVGRANKEGIQGQPRVAKLVDTLGWSDCGHNDYRPGVVLDPFAGAGTTLLVARKLGRHSIGIELNPEYAELIAKRTRQLSLLADETAA